MKKWKLFISCTLLLLTACTAPTESDISENGHSSEIEVSNTSQSEPEISSLSPDLDPGPISEPEVLSSDVSSSSTVSEESSTPNPDIGADPSPEEIELSRNSWGLQEHLKKVLPLESYLYVCIDYVNSDGGDLMIGIVDEETVRSAVDSYTGAPCRQVIYQPAECSLAQVMDLSRAIAGLDFPDRTTAHTRPDQGWRGGGIDVIICADEDADADWIESEVMRLADEQEFPEEYIYFARREGVSPLPPGVNPDS